MTPTRPWSPKTGGVLLLAALLVSVPLAGCLDEARSPAVEPSRDRADPDFGGPAVAPGNYTTNGSFSRVLEPGPHEAGRYVHEVLESPVDSAPVRVGVQLPQAGAEPVPLVVLASSKFEDPSLEAPPDADNHLRAPFLVENYVPHGYGVAFVALRGTGDDGTCRDPMGGPRMQEDLGRALDWLAGQPFADGRLATFGFSADSLAAWAGAAVRPGLVEGVVALSSSHSAFDAVVHNGTYDPAMLAMPATTHLDETIENGPREGLLCPQARKALLAATEYAATGGADRRGFWEARDFADEILAEYNGSVFIVHGLEDGLIWPSAIDPWLDRLEDAQVPTRVWLGDWGHAYPDGGFGYVPLHNPAPRWDFAETLLHWFDRTLAGNASVEAGPRVQVADSDGGWRTGTDWPPADARPRTLHPTPGGELAGEASDREGEVVLATGPEAAAPVAASAGAPGPGCAACERFSTAALEELRFAGRPALNLTVVPTSPRGHVTARLLSLDADGAETELTGGQIDLRFAHGGEEPRPVEPGEPVGVRLWLQPVDAVVPAGGRLVLELSQGFYRHGPPLGHPLDLATVDATHHSSAGSTPVAVQLGGGQSTLALETFAVTEDAFFEPP